MIKKINTIKQAENFLFGYIPQNTVFKFPGQLGLARAKYLLEKMGAPQNKLKVIHIAGTSGKGSTAYMIERLLRLQGKKTGLHVSPHLTDIRERFQINGGLITVAAFCRYLTEIIPIIYQVEKAKYGVPTYFEILVALSFWIFYKEQVDYAVVETGLGGWLDGTNVVDRADKLSVITKIGLDHQRILGNTLEKIALQKAMITCQNSQVLSIHQRPSVTDVIDKVVKEKDAHIDYIKKGENYTTTSSSQDSAQFDFSFKGVKVDNIKLSLIGDYQVENASLALASTLIVAQRDGFKLSESALKRAMSTITIPGRFDIIKREKKTMIVDGAHNPQKMKAFTTALKNRFPGEKFTFLLAFKKGKDFRGMLKYIIPLADKIIITQFFVNTTYTAISLSLEPEIIANAIKKMGFNNFLVEKHLERALEQNISKEYPIVVTGSLYLIAEVYPYLAN